MVSRRRSIIRWTIAVTLVVEAVTVFLRFGLDSTADEFNKTAPLILQVHHMFWSVPVFAAVPFVWRRPHLSGGLLGIGFGFIVSDLAHHFVVLPMTIGGTGWHWP